MLRVALNAEDNPLKPANYDLYLIKGDSEKVEQAVCSSKNPSQFEFCEVPKPDAGVWTFVVRRVTGSEIYQVTATLY